MRTGPGSAKAKQQSADAATDGTPLLRDGNLELLFAVTVLSGTSLSAITPAFPAVQAALQIPAAATGLLITVYTLPGIILAPLLGVIADRVSRKRVLVFSLLLYGLAGGACAFAPDFALLLGLRFVQGIGDSILFALSVAIISDHYGGARRTRALAFNSVAVGLGAAIFPVIGGLLVEVSWRLPFALAFLTVPLALLLLRRFDIPDLKRQLDLRGYLHDLLAQLQQRAVRGNLLVTVLVSILLVGAVFGYLPQTLEARFGVSALLIGVIFAARALSVAGISLVIDRLLQHVSLTVLTRYAAALMMLALIIIPLLTSFWWLLLPAVLFGIAYGVLLTTLELLLADDTPPAEHAALIALQSSAGSLGDTAGPVLMGVIYGAAGGSVTFFVAAGVAALMLVLTFRMLG